MRRWTTKLLTLRTYESLSRSTLPVPNFLILGHGTVVVAVYLPNQLAHHTPTFALNLIRN